MRARLAKGKGAGSRGVIGSRGDGGVIALLVGLYNRKITLTRLHGAVAPHVQICGLSRGYYDKRIQLFNDSLCLKTHTSPQRPNLKQRFHGSFQSVCHPFASAADLTFVSCAPHHTARNQVRTYLYTNFYYFGLHKQWRLCLQSQPVLRIQLQTLRHRRRLRRAETMSKYASVCAL
jgi:hypothetical protein